MKEYERTNAEQKLMDELEKGRRSGEENGWLSAGEVAFHFSSPAESGQPSDPD